MEAGVIRRNSRLIAFEVFFFLGLLSFNGIANTMGWTPAKELIKQVKARSHRTGRKLREVFN